MIQLLGGTYLRYGPDGFRSERDAESFEFQLIGSKQLLSRAGTSRSTKWASKLASNIRGVIQTRSIAGHRHLKIPTMVLDIPPRLFIRRRHLLPNSPPTTDPHMATSPQSWTAPQRIVSFP